ncbi:U4/U6.U5 tri-snRNP-associated protein 1 [Dermacentor variabilis]|uniref:U4/U6.U5 tri-snRNP-associated protein 1 n=1 Tax=Dermacentor variabilis TaxID=34621 RepID=UPI003F5B5DF6
MGSSKKHKDKDRERDRDKEKSKDKKKSRRSRSKSRERDGTKEKHRHRDRKRARATVDDEGQPVEKVRVKEERELSPRPKQEQSGSESDTGHQDKSSLSIDETNKLRAKLGLKPLQVDGGGIPGLGDVPLGDANEDEGEKRKEVFVKTENMQEKVEAQKLREKITANREKRKIAEKYREMKGLGDSDEDDDALQWVRKSRKLQEEKEKAEKRAKMLEEMDEEFGVGKIVEEELKPVREYTAKHLKGLEVLHSTERFKEGQSVILTLKDQGVLDEGDDVLENVNLVEAEKAERNVENRKGKPGYQPYDDTEVDEFGIVKKKSLLYKYDEEIEGVKQQKFSIGAGPTEADKERELQMVRMKLKQKQKDSLVMPAPQIATEYLTPDEMATFKKTKKKVRKTRKRETFKVDDLAPLPGHEDDRKDHGSRRRRENNFTEPVFVNPQSQQFFDEAGKPPEEDDMIGPDEDLTGVAVEEDDTDQALEAALTKARRLRLAEGSSLQKIAESARLARDQDVSEGNANSAKAIVLNSTAEFCRTLGDIPTYGMSGNREEEAEELLDMDIENEEEDQGAGDAANRGAWNEVDIEEKPVEIKDREKEPILEEEPDLSVGISGALRLAVKKGYIETGEKKIVESKKHSDLHAQSYTIEEKFYDDDKASRRERYCGPVSDFKEKDSYKPDVKLEYIDDGGRILNAKEAFRYLSHKFHGKGSGKNKVDKRAKKVDQAVKLKQMSSTDTPLNTLKLLQEKQKELQSPYILLSGGSKALNQSSLMKPK